MITDQTLRRLAANKPGLILSHVREVVLPIMKLTLEVLLQVEKPLPALQEYALRAVEGQINTPHGVSEFLGIEEEVLTEPLQELWNLDLIDISTGQLKITPGGERALRDLAAITPVREEYQVNFDLSLRRVVGYRPSILRPKDVQDQGLEEVPVPKGHRKRPHADELAIDEVGKLLQRASSKRDSTLTLVAIRDVIKAERFFEPALLLVYVDPAASTCHVSLALDERVSPEHESALGLAGGVAAIGLDCPSFIRSRPDVRDLLPERLLNLVVPDRDYRALELNALEEGSIPDGDEEDCGEGPTIKERNEAVDSAAEAKQAIQKLVVRPVRVYEHPEILRSAVEASVRRLLIISPWITSGVVTSDFLQRLEATCRRGIPIHIGFGIGENGPFGRKRDESPIRKLSELSRRSKNFTFVELGNTHAKTLICDDFIVNTSFNWLSFRGDPDRTFRQEEGVLVREPAYVDEEYKYYCSIIEASGG